MILVVGATGLLGSEICRQLASRGDRVRALVRRTSNPERVSELAQLGIDLVTGDLKEAPTLRAACRGAEVVVSTASSTLSRQAGDSIETVDLQGQLDLIAAAEAEGVKRFVLVSFRGSDTAFPLQDAKRAVEARLRQGPMTHVILQPTCFMEIWLSPALGFDPANSRILVLGAGRNRISWISLYDVAAYAVAAIHAPRAENVTLPLGGPEALSPLEVASIAERLLGRSLALQHLPEEALRSQFASAGDSLQRSMAGLMLYCAHGDVIDNAEAEAVLSVAPQRSVQAFLSKGLAGGTI